MQQQVVDTGFIDWVLRTFLTAPWAWTAIFLCPWASHLLTQLVRQSKIMPGNQRQRRFFVWVFAVAMTNLLSGWAFHFSPLLSGGEGWLAAFLVGVIQVVTYEKARKWSRKNKKSSKVAALVDGALDGTVYLDDEPTAIQTLTFAALGAKTDRERRQAPRTDEADGRAEE